MNKLDAFMDILTLYSYGNNSKNDKLIILLNGHSPWIRSIKFWAKKCSTWMQSEYEDPFGPLIQLSQEGATPIISRL